VARIVVALGGNALIRRGDPGSIEVQRRNLIVAASSLVELASAGHDLVLTHGNGPQVGYLAIETDAARDVVPPPPLDVLVAESQGQIGYLLTQALTEAFAARGKRPSIAALLTQVVVDRADPAFRSPTKPVGPPYDEATARALAADHGWSVARDGSSWRRVVASPAPRSIVEAPSIGALVDAGMIVVACGGGGIPVARDPDGSYVGVEAVIDKDSCAVLLAEEVQADALLLLTDVAAVHVGWGTSSAVPLRRLSVAGAEAGVADGAFAPGSMGPKVAAAADFVRRTGRRAGIGSLEDAVAVFEGRKGTMLVDEIERRRPRAA
jgi:carbamate kinase